MEQIFKLIPKQRRPQENYQQPWPLPEIPEDELLALADLALEHIDEVIDDTAPL